MKYFEVFKQFMQAHFDYTYDGKHFYKDGERLDEDIVDGLYERCIGEMKALEELSEYVNKL